MYFILDLFLVNVTLGVLVLFGACMEQDPGMTKQDLKSWWIFSIVIAVIVNVVVIYFKITA